MTAPLRFGIVGTGQWSGRTHIPAAAASDSIEFVGAIGRGDDYAAFLHTVDAVGFAVPPDVEAALALRAIDAGKHVLLDKPVALDAASAEALSAAASRTGVATLVFLTRRFIEPVARWLDETAATGGWSYGRVEMLSAALARMPNPGWRAERGGLWDIGPHALSLLGPVLGPVRSVSAHRAADGLVVATMTHDAATSVMSVTIGGPQEGSGDSVLFTGAHGRTAEPELSGDEGSSMRAYSRAIDALVAQVDDPGHPCDVHVGAEIVRVLDAAERSIATGGPIGL